MSEHPLAVAARAAGDGGWLVGGAVRDEILGRPTTDFDVVVAGEPRELARTVARGAAGHAFELSEAFGAWRVVARDRRWQLDVLGLDGQTLAQDLVRRDLTINAIARPLDAGPGATEGMIDPFGGIADLRSGTLRMVSPRSFVDDPLRVLRLARFGAQLSFEAEPATVAAAQDAAPGLGDVAPERVFAELRGLICAVGALRGLALMDALGATDVLLPELAGLHGVVQSPYHHLDVHDHTLAVVAETIALVEDPTRLGIDAGTAARLSDALAQPLANELTRGQALRFGALLHDIAKPRTRDVGAEGRITFMGHDALGAELGVEILGRLRTAERLRAHVAALTRHHLRLGFLVHQMPLTARARYDYLHACGAVAVDVTVLSVADRLATRGRNAEEAIARHLELASQMIAPALDFEAEPPRPAIRGDELAAALELTPGPRLGELLAELTAAAYTGEATDRATAIAHARALLR